MLREVCNDFSVPGEKIPDLAILNGMEVGVTVKAGTRITIVA